MALRCLARYRNHGLPWAQHVQPGEVLAGLTAAQEEYLLRDSPDSFERLDDAAASEALVAGFDAPPADKMVKRERAARKSGEHAPGVAMGSADHPGLVPGGGKG